MGMSESSPVNPADVGLEVRTYFVRNRNALVARAAFSELFVDYYLHLSEHKIRLRPEFDAMFKRALVGLTLHCASRPWNELVAWTLHFQDPLVSEQRAAKYFQLAEEEFVLVAEHPDCDHTWFESLTTDAVKTLDTTETLALMERRIYRWHCGCNQRRMLEVLAPTAQQDIGALFEADEKIEIRCPRCGARHAINREAMEAFLQKP